ncbi:MAG: hypothetical protein V4628_14215 [Pseudomonadota bacterium]
MLKRFTKIKNEFGNIVLSRILLVGIGMIVMSVAAVYFYQRHDMPLITIAITLIAFIYRVHISNYIGNLAGVFRIGFIVYGVILFLGDRLGIANDWKLFIITITTALVFNLQFWGLSDPDVYKITND